MTVEELNAFFTSYNISPNTKLFISQDPEGNGYNEIDYDVAIEKTLNNRKAVILYPIDRGRDWNELFKKPKT